MQAKGYLHGSVHLSTEHKGTPRKHPVWVLRYRLPSGKYSRKTLGRAWLKSSRPRVGFTTETQARAVAQRFLDDHASALPEHRRTFGLACDAFLTYCECERGLRASTLHEYRRIIDRLCERPWRQGVTWRDRPLDGFTERDILTLRAELVAANRNADTLNHYRRVVRGAFGTHALSPALAWRWTGAKPESEGQLRFYTPAQLAALKQNAHLPIDVAIYTLAAEAGPRLSEIRGLKVRNVDFGVGVVRFEDGFYDPWRTRRQQGAASPVRADERQRASRSQALLQR